MKKTIKLVGLLLAAMLVAALAGCGKKIANVEQIKAEYRIASVMNLATDRLYPNKPQALELEQVYTKWSIQPVRGITVTAVSFVIKPFAEANDALQAAESFTVDVVVNTYDKDAGDIVSVTVAESKVVLFGSPVEISLGAGGAAFAKETPKDKKERCTIDIYFKVGGQTNDSVKFTLEDLTLGTK